MFNVRGAKRRHTTSDLLPSPPVGFQDFGIPGFRDFTILGFWISGFRDFVMTCTQVRPYPDMSESANQSWLLFLGG